MDANEVSDIRASKPSDIVGIEISLNTKISTTCVEIIRNSIKHATVVRGRRTIEEEVIDDLI